MKRVCPYGNKHWVWQNVCKCVWHDPHFYYNGKWNYGPKKPTPPDNPMLTRSGYTLFGTQFFVTLILFILVGSIVVWTIFSYLGNHLLKTK